MAKRPVTQSSTAKPKPTPQAGQSKAVRFSAEDLKLIDQLKQKTRIGNTSDVIKYALGIAAEKHGITF